MVRAASPEQSPGARRAPRRWVLLAILAVALLGWDLARAAERQWSARGLLLLIDGYQATLSPRMGKLGARCRFRPTCSHYGEAVIARHGALVGGMKAAGRILRCGPWTPAGTYDPPSVPAVRRSDAGLPQEP